MKHHYCYCTLF